MYGNAFGFSYPHIPQGLVISPGPGTSSVSVFLSSTLFMTYDHDLMAIELVLDSSRYGSPGDHYRRINITVSLPAQLGIGVVHILQDIHKGKTLGAPDDVHNLCRTELLSNSILKKGDPVLDPVDFLKKIRLFYLKERLTKPLDPSKKITNIGLLTVTLDINKI